jgi:hypothetical protein
LLALYNARTGTVKLLKQSMPLKKRRTEGLVQKKSGYRQTFVDAFSAVFGEDWTCVLDALQPGEKAERRSFAGKLLTSWGLDSFLHGSSTKKKSGFVIPPTDKPCQVDVRSLGSLALLLPPLNRNDGIWNLNSKQFELILDNKPLAQMLNGESFYNGIANFDIVTGIIGLLNAFFEKGWSPRCTVLPVAICVHNALPDFLANYAIDNEKNFD